MKWASQQDMNQYGPWLRAASPTRRPEKMFNRFHTQRGPNYVHHEEGFPNRWERGRKNSEEQGRGWGNSGEGGGGTGEYLGAGNSRAHNEYIGKYGFTGDMVGGYGDYGYRKKMRVTKKYSKKDLGESTGKVPNMENDFRGFGMESDCESLDENKLDSPRSAGTLHGLGLGQAKGQQLVDSLGQGKHSRSPITYMGPLISEVEKSMKKKSLGLKGETNFHKNSPEKMGATCEKRGRGHIDSSSEICCQLMKTIPTSVGPVTKGRKMSNLAGKNIGLGMAEAVVQPH